MNWADSQSRPHRRFPGDEAGSCVYKCFVLSMKAVANRLDRILSVVHIESTYLIPLVSWGFGVLGF